MKCQNDRERAVLLAQKEAQAGTLRLVYRLESKNGFWMSVACEEEIKRVFLGRDLEIAWSFFCEAARGSVTPCVLGEVFGDWLDARSLAR